ncbi:DUF7344 domain-containing protein [Natrinema soli]|uniref:DUF7344 domain-containing protein n=1 Tax=Natrinema soli TaxID=1930624 RepID=A0ABD5SHT5_9EURY|nr:hypothetical protein [Natrinema soli]
MSLKTEYSFRFSDHLSSGRHNDLQADQSPALSQDEIFHILQVSRRRETLNYLLEKDGPVKMRDIAEYIAANEHNTTVEGLTSRQRQRVYIPLYQSHLPKLDTKGIIDYEQSRGIVRLAERFDLFRPYLELDLGSSSDERRTARYSVLAITASASLISAAVLGLLPISDLALSMLILTLFGCVESLDGGRIGR